MPTPMVFEWYGVKLSTMGDIFEEVLRIVGLEDPLLATEFIDDYGTYLEKVNEHESEIDGRYVACQNLGYMAGYYDQETRTAVYDFFEIEHPFFGRAEPTPEEAFKKGQEWGQAIKEGRPFPE